jgi:hypothetical protein
VIAYVDDFKLMMIMSILALPFVVLLRTKPPSPVPVQSGREVAAE